MDKLSLFLLGLALLLLTIPRLTYLIDWLPGNTTLTHSDDFARILEIIAMTGNSSYPLLSPSNNNYLFSFYYSTLYPFSIIKLTFPFLTIIESIALGNLFYHTLVLLSIYELAHLILRNTEKIRVFIFLCTIFGGLDWLASGSLFSVYGHFEWWQCSLSGNTQISSFYTGLFWTIHHFLAAFSVVLAYAILFHTYSFKTKGRKLALILTVLISSFYASPFAFMSVPLYLFIHRKIVWKAIKSWYSLLIILLSLLPLPIFLNKFPSQSFIWSTFRLRFTDNFYIDKILSFPLFITLVPLVEFMAIPILLLITWRCLNKSQKQYISASWVFFVSTYFIAYSGSNNYSMRGMFIPTFVFFFIFAQNWLEIMQYMKSKIKPSLIFFILLFCITGTFKEFLGRTKEAVKNSYILRSALGISEPAFLNVPIYEIATDKNVKTIKIESCGGIGRKNIYHFEKFIENLELANMEDWEKELLRRP